MACRPRLSITTFPARKSRTPMTGNSRSNYLNLRSGVNLGAWRLRNVSSMQYDQQRRHWDSQSTWLQRDVRSLKSLLRIGDTHHRRRV
jgi:outer membrane usher protein FimD/PapC